MLCKFNSSSNINDIEFSCVNHKLGKISTEIVDIKNENRQTNYRLNMQETSINSIENRVEEIENFIDTDSD